jgi:DNA-binding transcriptional LysR family regulator
VIQNNIAMDNLSLVRSFVAVVERDSFTRAAAHLGLSKGRVSAQIKELEAELGIALFTRTTREVVLTDAGRRFFEHGMQLLQMAEAAVSAARVEHESLVGELRVTSTVEYAQHLLVAALAEFSALHPRLHVELVLTARMARLVAERIDVGIRLGAQLRDSAYRSVRLARFRLLAVASPRYLAGRERPQVPSELRRLDWMMHIGFESPYAWSANGERKKAQRVKLPCRFKADSAAALLAFVLAARGAAILPEWMVTEARAAGRIVELLPSYRLPEVSAFAVYPATSHVPAKVRLFVEFLRAFIAR